MGGKKTTAEVGLEEPKNKSGHVQGSVTQPEGRLIVLQCTT